MKKRLYWVLGLLALASGAIAADIKIGSLPLGSATSTGSADSFPYVVSSTNVTKRMTLWDLINLPPLVSTYAPKNNAVFTGTTTSPSFIGPLTGNASTATALAANPTDCSSNQYATAIAANGNLTCSAVTTSQLSGTVGISQGGTGQVTKAAAFDALSPMTTVGDIVYGGASGTGTRLAGGTTGQRLTANTGAAPTWSTTTWPNTTTANQILYSVSSNTIGQITTAATSALVTDASSVPGFLSGSVANRVLRTNGTAISFSQVGLTTDVTGALPLVNGGTGTAAGSANAAFNALSPMTTGGDLIYGGASGAATRLANGSSGQVLTSGGGTAAPTWSAPATASYKAPTFQGFLSGTGTYNLTYAFTVTSASATVGATYTNNSVTFTVYATIASSTTVYMSGSGAPLSSGTLTKASGTGDATITFSLYQAPLYLDIEMVGGGGGGGAGTSSGGTAGDGGITTFGPITCNGGGGGKGGSTTPAGGTGGTASLGSGPVGIALSGADGTRSSNLLNGSGYQGAPTPFGGGGFGGLSQSGGGAAPANTGAGGGSGGAGSTTQAGGAGAAGGYAKAKIISPSATYSYGVGAAGTGGGGGPDLGGAGALGQIAVWSYYQ